MKEKTKRWEEKAVPFINVKDVSHVKNLNPNNIDVPGDPSSAAFFTALTLLNKNSKLKIRNVGLNPTRNGFY